MSKPKVAVFTFAGGFKHGSLGLAEETLKKIGEQSGAFEAVPLGLYKQDSEKVDLGVLTPEFLKQCKAVVFYTTSGGKDLDLLTPAQRDALMGAIKEGRLGFVGVHCATDTFYKWPEYGEMVGAYFDGHPWGADSAPVTIKIEDRDHPACLPLGASWLLQDEIYQFKEPYDRKKLHVLMSLDTKATDMTLPEIKRKDGDFAVAWTKMHGKGRVFYTALGHRDEVWKDELYQKHMLGGIRWALGQSPGKPAEENAVTTASGLQYIDLVLGDGPTPRAGQMVAVHYTGWLTNGKEFQSSRSGNPLQFPLGVGKVIKGWDEGLSTMKVGGKRKLIVPPHLGYGADGFGDAIPPNAKLVFEIELVSAK